MPAPNGSSPARKCQYEEPTSSVAKIRKPVAIRLRPAAPATRTPRRAASSGATRESGITTSAIGTQRRGSPERREAHHELQVRQRQEQEAEHGEELHGHRQRAGAEAAAEEVARVEHRLAAAQLPERRTRRCPATPAASAERSTGRRPAALGALDDPEHERRQPGHREQRADRVEPRRVRSRVCGTIASVPASATAASTTFRPKTAGHEPLEQNARDEQADHGAAGGDARPGADGLAALLGREDRRDHRQRHRHHERGADAHQRCAGRSARRVCRRTSRASDASPNSASPTASTGLRPKRSPIAPAGSSSAANDERVRVDDPLQLRLRGAGVPGDLRQRDVEARDGRDDHHQREAHDAQHRPPLLPFVLKLIAVHRPLLSEYSTLVEFNDCRLLA